MEIGKAFTFVTDDESWISKIGIGAVVAFFSILIIPAFFLGGYQLKTMRNVMNGEEYPLPKWENWGRLFMDGLFVVVAAFVYTLPIWLLACIGIVLSFLVGDSSAGGAVNVVFWIFGGCFIIFFVIAMAFILPAIYIQYVRTDDFGALFRFGEVIGIARENLVDILITLLVTLAAWFVLSLITTILSITICGGIIATYAGTVWISVAMGHLYGQIAAKTNGKVKEAYAA